MNRCKDYVAFIVSFAGIGYLALWPLNMNGAGGSGFGSAWNLPPALHVIGLVSAAFVLLRGIALLVRRQRRRRAAKAVPAARLAVVPARPPRWQAPPSTRVVKARAQFGLRGMRR